MTSSTTNQYAVVVCLVLVLSGQSINAKPANPSQPMGSGSVSQDYMDLQAILGHRLSGSTQEKVKIVDLLLQLLEEIDLPTLCDVIANDTSGLKSANEINLKENVKDKEILPTVSAAVSETVDPTISTSSASVTERQIDASTMSDEMKEFRETSEEIEILNEESEELEEEEQNMRNEEDKEVEDNEEDKELEDIEEYKQVEDIEEYKQVEDIEEDEEVEDSEEDKEVEDIEEDEQVEDIEKNDVESVVSPTVKEHHVDMHTSPYWNTRRPLRRRVVLRPRGFQGKISSDGTLPFPGGKRRTFRRVKLGDLKKVWLPVSKIDGVSLPSPINNIDMHGENDESKRYLIKRFNLARPRSQLYSGSLILGGEKFVKDMNPALDEKTMKSPSMTPTRAGSENEVETDGTESGEEQMRKKVISRPKGKVVRRIIYRKRKDDKGVKRGPVRYKVVRRVSPQNTADKTLGPAERRDVAKIMYLKRQAMMRQQLYRGKTGRTAGRKYRILRNGRMRGNPKRTTNPMRPRIVRIPRKYNLYNMKSNRQYHPMVNNKKGYRIQRYPVTKQNVYERPVSHLSPSVQSPPETTFSARAVVYPTVITSMEVMTTGSETVLPTIEMTREPEPSSGSSNENTDYTNSLVENERVGMIFDLGEVEKNGNYKVLQPLIRYEDIDNMVEPLVDDKVMDFKLSENDQNQFEAEGEKGQESGEEEIHLGNDERSEQTFEQVSNSITGEMSQNKILLSDTASVQQSSVILPSSVKPSITHGDAATGAQAGEKVMDTTNDESSESIVGDSESIVGGSESIVGGDLLQSATDKMESTHTRYEAIDKENILIKKYQHSEENNNVPIPDLSPEFTLTNRPNKTDIEPQPTTTMVTVEKEDIEDSNETQDENISIISVKTEFGNGSSLVAESRIISIENASDVREQTTVTYDQTTEELSKLKSEVKTPIATTTMTSGHSSTVGLDTHSPNKQEVGETSTERQNKEEGINAHLTKDHKLRGSDLSTTSLPTTSSNLSLKTDSTTVAVENQDTKVEKDPKEDEEGNKFAGVVNEATGVVNEATDVVDIMTEGVTQLPTQPSTKPKDAVIGESNASSELNVPTIDKDYDATFSTDSKSDLTDSITVASHETRTMEKPDEDRVRHVLMSPYMPVLGGLVYETEVTRSNETSSNDIESNVGDDASQDVSSSAAPSETDETAFQSSDDNSDNEFLTVIVDEKRQVLLPTVTLPGLIIPETTQTSNDDINDKSVTTDEELNPASQDQTTGISDMLSSFSNYISTQLFSDDDALGTSTIATTFSSSSQEPLAQTMKEEPKESTPKRDVPNGNDTTVVKDNDQTSLMNKTGDITESQTVVINASTPTTPTMKSVTQKSTVAATTDTRPSSTVAAATDTRPSSTVAATSDTRPSSTVAATTDTRPSSKSVVSITTVSKLADTTVTPNDIANNISSSPASNPRANVTITSTANAKDTDQLHGNVSQNLGMKSNSSEDGHAMENDIINGTGQQQSDNESVLVISHTIHLPVINNNYESLTNEISNTVAEITNNKSKVESHVFNNAEQNQENLTTIEHIKAPRDNGVHTEENATEKENTQKNTDGIDTQTASQSETGNNENILLTTSDARGQTLSDIVISEGLQNEQDTEEFESDSNIETSATVNEKVTSSEGESLSKENDIERNRWYKKSNINKLNNRFEDWQRFGSVNGEAIKLAGLEQLAGLHGMRHGEKPRTSVYNKLGSETLNKYQNPLTGEYVPPKTGNIDLWKAYNIAVSQGENNQAYDKRNFEKHMMWNSVPWAKSMPASGQSGERSNGQSTYNGGFSGAVGRGVTGYLHPDLGFMNSPYSSLGKVHEEHWGNRFSQGFYGRVQDGSHPTSAESSHRAGVSNPAIRLDKESGEENESEDEENVSSPQVVISKNGQNDDFSEEELRKMLNENIPLYDPDNELKSFDHTLVQKPKPSSTMETGEKNHQYATEKPNRSAGGQMEVETGQWPNSETTGQMGVPAPGDYTCPGMFGYHKDPYDCQAFFICSWGVPYRLHCPPGTRFNPKQSVCDWAVNVDCPNRRAPL